ncbi:DUF2118 domain-containing protein [Methanopyrus sp.]
MVLPRIYVETDEVPESGKILLTDPEFEVIVRSRELAEKIAEELNEPVFYKQVVYEEARSVFDVPEAKVTRHVVIEPVDRRSLVFLKPGDRVYQIPVEGYVVTPIADVGDRLRKGDPLAAVTTRSGNVRYVEAPQDCLVVYVCEQPAIRTQRRPNYEYYIAPTE